MYNRPTSKLTVSQRLSIMRKGKSIHSSSQQSLDIVPPERPLIQKFMFWKRPCLPRDKSSIDSKSDEVLEQTVCFEPSTQDPCSTFLEKSGVTSSDESSVASQQQQQLRAVAEGEPLVASPPPPPPGEPGPHEDRDEAAAPQPA